MLSDEEYNGLWWAVSARYDPAANFSAVVGAFARAVLEREAAALTHPPAASEREGEDPTDEHLCKLADMLWEQGHISDLSKGTAVIFARAVLATFPTKDGARFRWLTEDHDDPRVRDELRSLFERLPVMSYSAAVDAAIDAQRLGREKEEK